MPFVTLQEGLTEAVISSLYELDRTHWLHPQGDLGAGPAVVPQLIFSHGRGATLTDVHGRTYIDGMSALWNVNVGYGRAELAEAAAEQMRSLAFSTAYGGQGHAPGILLAEKLAELAPGDLETTFFASGGAEANDTAYKLARFVARVRGEPERVNIVARQRAYHGLTLGATSATGIPLFKKDFGPLAPGFLHGPAPDPYRFDGEPSLAGAAYARALEEVILDAGPGTVAAVVAEPVQGAGGVIVPPREYLPLVRELCDRHDALLIADEVITGFGRTGTWFGVQQFGVQPDLMVFAKGVTSGYLPLSGVMLSHEVQRTLRSAGGILAHGFTYSGHPTSCAVALRNLRVIEEEGLVERAAVMGRRLRAGLDGLRRHELVGDVRSLGLIAGVEVVRDRSTKESFDPAQGVARQVCMAALESGVIVRALPGDVIALCPPLVVSEPEIDRIVEALDAALTTVTPRI